MSGWILLEGGAEFGGGMAAPDRRALALAGGADAPLVILPTAAAPDHNDRRAGQNGARWFASLGARRVAVLPLVDRVSANDPAIAAAIRDARLIYLLGGFTHYLGQTLAGSLSLAALQAAHQGGAVIAGSSAGAMVLCEHYFNPESGQVVAGLNFVPAACLIPHHNTFGQGWAPGLARLLPGVALIGVDEQTGLLNDGQAGQWKVYGRGGVTLYRQGTPVRYSGGEEVSLFPAA
jgi:cyanophycinase